MIIGVSGYSGSGKSTIGKIIWELDHTWEMKMFAGKLKLIASILTGIPVEMFEDQEFKKTDLGPEWNTKVIEKKWLPKGIDREDISKSMTVRMFLQLLGTDAMRNCLHDNIWVNALFADYKSPKMSEHHPSKWVITDVRFPNEAKAIKDKGGVIIRVDRPGYKPINSHPSEVALDDWEFDFKIANVSDITSLELTVKEILKQIKLL